MGLIRRWTCAAGCIASVISISSSHGQDVTTMAPAGSLPDEVRSIASSRILLWYGTAADSPTVSQVELWTTVDHSKSWQRAELHDAIASPIAFDAPADGLYGFYLILQNEAGASSPPPGTGTSPQQWVRVDRSAPIVQVLAVRPDAKFDQNREIHLRWTVGDDDLPDRPVSLYYRTEQTKTFQLFADCLAARSAYGWAVPEGMTGRVEVKVSATDRAGNTGVYLVDGLKINDPKSQSADKATGANAGPGKSATEPGDNTAQKISGDPAKRVAASLPSQAEKQAPDVSIFKKASYHEPDAGTNAVSAPSVSEARKKYEQGTYYRLRGDNSLAIARFKDALALDPKLLAARCDLAGLTLLSGDVEKAEEELHRVLAEDPAYRPALRGLALVQTRQKNYQSARETLDKLLLLEPRDAEGWLAYGDVMLFTGDRAGARQAWGKADKFCASNDDLKKRAAKRLEIYSDTGTRD